MSRRRAVRGVPRSISAQAIVQIPERGSIHDRSEIQHMDQNSNPISDAVTWRPASRAIEPIQTKSQTRLQIPPHEPSKVTLAGCIDACSMHIYRPHSISNGAAEQ